ncbi:MAG: IS30 family transposase [Robiginitomaculum sp.]|nr:IS30 family transposase [Robiginitomaculum sp.]
MGYIYGQLSQNERLEIYHFNRQGLSIRAIGRRLYRAASTISREIVRNSHVRKQWAGGYCPVRAHRLTRLRRVMDKSRFKLVRQPELQTFVRNHLAMGWSPEQISGRLARDHGVRIISHESIYRYIYYRRAQKDYLFRLLPRKKSRRGKMRGAGQRVCGQFLQYTAVCERPEPANTRKQAGHWEIDMMQFSKPRQSLLMSCERQSRYIMASKQTGLKSADIAQTLVKRFAHIPLDLRRSATFDNGTEFWQHYRLIEEHNMQTYFCKPRCPWEKGSVENAIGRLRRYLPRKTDTTKLTKQSLKEIINAYNNTPRQCLDYQTPNEVYTKLKTVALQT